MTSPRKGHQTKNVSQPGWREGGAARPRSALLSLNGSTSGGRAGGSCSPASRGPPSPNPGCLFPSRPQSRSGPPRCRRGREGCGGGGRRCCRCCCWRCGAGSRGGRERSARQRTQVGRGARAVHLPSAPPRSGVTALSSLFREQDGLRSPFVWVSWGIFYTAGEKGWRNRYLFPNYTLHVFGRVHRMRWLLPTVSRDHHGM